ncbi:MAG: hypothetical protein Q9M89_01390 [Persephonella sp.]|nr:hypothetical protein [Persephonella sp.]
MERLKESHLNSRFHTNSYRILLQYEKMLDKKTKNIHYFETVNSLIKNSQIYIPSLNLKYIEIVKNPDVEYFLVLNRIMSSLFIIKNALDKSFITELENDISLLKRYRFNNPKLENFHNILLSHLNVFIKTFPDYYTTLQYLLEDKSDTKLINQLKTSFIEETKKESRIITVFSFGSTGLFLSVLGYLAFLLIKLEMNNRLLRELRKNLEKKMVTDELTGLPNRKAFFTRETHYKNPSFILCQH